MNFTPEMVKALASALKDSGLFVTVSDFDKFAASLAERHNGAKSNDFSITKAIRGLAARQGKPLNGATVEEDLNYAAKALATGSTPGSYLVPAIQANEIIQFLSTNGVARASGVRVWPLNGIQKLNVPVASALPTVQWLGQNSTDTASDPNLGQLPFDLKTRRSLVAIPNELLATSNPSIDSIVTELLGVSFAEHEDDSFFGTASKSNGPTCIYASANITTLNTAGSANGGNLAYSDLTGVLAKAAAVKAKGPFAWFMSPRTFWTRVASILDSNSRPIFNPLASGMQDAIVPKLFGSPVYVTPFISETEANGSGTNQSHIIYTNPKYMHIADGGAVEIMVSLDRYFEFNQVGIRGIHRADYGVGPAAGIVVLKGVN